MIEPMKHVTVVCLQEDRQAALGRLAEFGCIHVRDVRSSQSAQLEELVHKRDQAQRALAVLTARERGESEAADTTESAEQIVERVLRTREESHHLQEEAAHWARVNQHLKPWGSFRKDLISRIEQAGWKVILGHTPTNEWPSVPEEAAFFEINQDGDRVYYMVVAPADIPVEVPAIPLPEITDRDEVEQKRKGACTRVEELEKALDQLTVHIDRVRRWVADLGQAVDFVEAREGMGEAGRLCYLQGYVPQKRLGQVVDGARDNGWAVQSRDPEKDDTRVPTLITLPRWVEPIRVVFQGLGIMPGYREIDISAWFLLFFSVFFAMLIGDAAYGLLFLAATLVARKKLPDAPAQPFWLFGILSVTTIIWGVLTGTYFGISYDALPAPLAGATLPWLDPHKILRMREDITSLPEAREVVKFNIMKFCFVLGAIHLSVAHAWNAVIFAPGVKALSEVAWVFILWGNYFLAGQLVLGETHGSGLYWALYGTGMSGVVLFSCPTLNVLKAVGGGIGELLLGIINSFVDVVSYVRLFAVGAASLAVEQSFNQMALQLDLPGVLTWLAAAFILVLVHGLNILLGAMGVLVHGIRLNVLEFSGHLGMQWTGTPYAPLSVNRDRVATVIRDGGEP